MEIKGESNHVMVGVWKMNEKSYRDFRKRFLPFEYNLLPCNLAAFGPVTYVASMPLSLSLHSYSTGSSSASERKPVIRRTLWWGEKNDVILIWVKAEWLLVYLVNEHFLATVVGHDEAPALRYVEPFAFAAFQIRWDRLFYRYHRNEKGRKWKIVEMSIFSSIIDWFIDGGTKISSFITSSVHLKQKKREYCSICKFMFYI